jgi:hypothetical protein
VLQQIGRQLLPSKDASSDRGCDRRLKMVRGIPFPDFSRCPIMELMHEFIEFERADSSALPTSELNVKLAQSLAQLTIVRDTSPFSNQAFDISRNVSH